MLTIDQVEATLIQDLATIRQFLSAQAQVKKYEPVVQQILQRIKGSVPQELVIQQADTIINSIGGIVNLPRQKRYEFTSEFVAWRDHYFNRDGSAKIEPISLPRNRERMWRHYRWIELNEAANKIRVLDNGWTC